MKNITSKLTALEVGHAYAIGLDGVATILTELESEELPVEMVDTTVFTFELKNKHFTLINTGCGSHHLTHIPADRSLYEQLSRLFVQ
ncbi:TPA: hypothetical protein R3422_004709 [Salmonella enterica subsp. enterica serovar Virchow]|nr:hypothetical protein [Salmonella enterica subsp. enterica serovar Montevideo]EDD1116344.1 hypothetical protein [Salmonella enterica subsp. enterica serovar Montevideo]HEC5773315.1 hypothetical protein [Salmonella enterica subsp. enterica serovar Virchow]HEC5775614.1 hypothetical protein [Salmonella enterica subsp. enterica serovar Virchow]